jgi:hypothetical protein
MRAHIVASLLLSLTLPVVPAWAQDLRSPAETELRIKQRRQRLVVRPPLDPRTAAQDAERAQTDQTAQERQQALVREVTREAISPYARRPHLDPDVVRGIQHRNIGRLSGR